MALSTVCPRCRGAIQPEDVTCGRCGLSLPKYDRNGATDAVPAATAPPLSTSPQVPFQPETDTQRLDSFPVEVTLEGSLPLSDLELLTDDAGQPVEPFSPEVAAAAEQPAFPDGPIMGSPPVGTQVDSPGQIPGTLDSAARNGPVEKAAPQPYTGPLGRLDALNRTDHLTGPLAPLNNTGSLARTGPLNNTGPLNQTGPLYYSGPLAQTGPLTTTGSLARQGALQLLPQEAIAYQMGALYLTNKRVILLAPTVVRSAFIRDIDAVGTLTERPSSWNLFFGALFVLLSIGAFWANGNRETGEKIFALLYAHPLLPMALATLLGALGLFMLARHFFWVKRSLFVSVKGRPLITVSMTDWSSRRLAGMDGFVNAFFQIKDFLTGDLMERQLTSELSERQVTGGLYEHQIES